MTPPPKPHAKPPPEEPCVGMRRVRAKSEELTCLGDNPAALTGLTKAQRLLRINEAIRHWLQQIDAHGHKIALALREIHDDKLYLATHTSFGAYYKDIFKKNRSRAYQLLNWAGLSTMVDTERHARVLAGHALDVQAVAVDRAGPDATAAQLQAVIDQVEIEETRTEETDAKASRRPLKDGNQLLAAITRKLGQALKMIDGSIHGGDELGEAISRALKVAEGCGY